MSIDFPDVYQSTVDNETVKSLFDDLARHADVVEVREKGGARDHGADAPNDLARAQARFLAGDVRGIQIRYRHEGQLWMDTLMATATGTRLVRVCVPAPPPRA